MATKEPKYSVVSKERDIIWEICNELERAEANHPEYPDDLVYRASIISEEAGELSKAVNNLMFVKYPEVNNDTNYMATQQYKSLHKQIRKEAIQIGAMVLRFLINFKTEAE